MFGRIVKFFIVMAVFTIAAGISTYFTLSLVIKSEDTVLVPDIIGKDVVNVLEQLTELDLNTKVKGSQFSVEVPKDHVIFQDPSAGAEIKIGRDIKIVVSRGPQIIIMPDLSGISIRRARIKIEELDLCRGATSSTSDMVVDKGDIIAQFPLPGSSVNRGVCVDLLVSKGSPPKSFKMPDLVGLQLDDALLTIDKSRLVHGEISVKYHRDKPKSSILEQVPLPGSRIEEWQPVNMVINRKKSFASNGSLVSEPSKRIFRYRIDKGFLKRHIQIQLKKGGLSQDLYDNFIGPDHEIWLIIPTDEEATLLVYEDEKLVHTEIFEN